MTFYSKTSRQNEAEANDIVLMLHDCITYHSNMTLRWVSMGVVKSRYQFSSS